MTKKWTYKPGPVRVIKAKKKLDFSASSKRAIRNARKSKQQARSGKYY